MFVETIIIICIVFVKYYEKLFFIELYKAEKRSNSIDLIMNVV